MRVFPKNMATGCVDLDEFRRNIDTFLKLSDQLKDGWRKESFEDTAHHVFPYIVKCNVLRHTPSTSQDNAASSGGLMQSAKEILEDELPVDIGGDDLCDDISLTEPLPTSSDIHQYEYHIVYSNSYHVPVLYFTASKADGKLLSLDEVWNSVPEYYQTRLKHQRWTFITQQEHPYLGRPFFQLHPCHTSDLMQSVQTTKHDDIGSKHRGNYLVTWLSSVGPVVGLSLLLEYSKLCDDTDR